MRICVWNRISTFRAATNFWIYNVKKFHSKDDPMILPSKLSGIDYLREPHIFKGQAFTMQERQTLRIHGLLAPCYRSQETQLLLIKQNFYELRTNLDKYKYLMGLLDRNERLFYAFVTRYVSDCLPIVYTPTVGLACQRYGTVFSKPRGLFITIYDKGHVFDVLSNWPEEDVRVIVVTDGERILGLGDLGAFGMGIPVGKLNLYTILGGILPHICLPVLLDVGTNNKDLLQNNSYIGLRQRRVVGAEYDEFLDEFMRAVVRRFGRECLIQFEDFGIKNAHRMLEKYRSDYCTFNDDVQGTAAVVLAALLSAMRITRRNLKDNVILFHGAGSAALGIANLIVSQMEMEGLSSRDAENQIWMDDVHGLLVHNRQPKPTHGQLAFAKNVPFIRNLAEIVKKVRPSIIIGVSAHKGGFTSEVLREMSRINDRPIIFALSNPTDKTECTPEEAITFTEGTCIYSSGSPFPPTVYKGKTHYTSQGNNSYIFPGVGLGVICAGMMSIPEKVFLIAAKSIANLVTDEMLEQGSILPPITDLQMCAMEIAKSLMSHAYTEGTATGFPEPADHMKYIKSQQFILKYPNLGASVYNIPTKVVSSEMEECERFNVEDTTTPN